MDILVAVIIAIVGTGGAGAVITAWRKSRPEAVDIGVGTQERIFAMANAIIDDLRAAREKDAVTIAQHEAKIREHEKRIRTLERRLADAGLPYNGAT